MTELAPGQEHDLHLHVNGRDVTVRAEARHSLADVLRDELGLTGTHLGCEHGVCGACTVMLDGRPARSCLVLAVQVEGRAITTIEGLADGETRHPVQEAMHDAMAFQCAFCAPGFLMSTLALLEAGPDPSREEIRAELSGNLCRCTGYESIVRGVELAVERLREAR